METKHTDNPLAWLENSTPGQATNDYASYWMEAKNSQIFALRAEITKLRANNAMLRECLQRMADGTVMMQREEFTHADTVHEYQRIARAALSATEGKS